MAVLLVLSRAIIRDYRVQVHVALHKYVSRCTRPDILQSRYICICEQEGWCDIQETHREGGGVNIEALLRHLTHGIVRLWYLKIATSQ